MAAQVGISMGRKLDVSSTEGEVGTVLPKRFGILVWPAREHERRRIGDAKAEASKREDKIMDIVPDDACMTDRGENRGLVYQRRLFRFSIRT